MATYTGNSGVVMIGANAIGEVRSFTIREESPRIEDTVLGDTNRTYKADIPTVDGTIECLFDPGDTNGQAAMTNGAEVSLVLRPLGTGSGLPNYTVTANITGIDGPNVAFGEMVSVTFSWAAAGALTKGTQS
jgi:hypothetical protein